MPQHFLRLSDFNPSELKALIRRGIELKQQPAAPQERFRGKTLAMIFSKSSTRTRVSFEVAMAQLGGHALFLSPRDTQLGRGEPIADTARVLSSMCDAVMMRNDSQAELEEFAANSAVPVINALTDQHHPCQILADIQAYTELRGNIAGATVTWVGDGNNVCNSWLEAARLFDFELRIAAPAGFTPAAEHMEAANGAAQLYDTPQAAVAGANLVMTDVWASMGQEAEQQRRATAFADYQVNETLMAGAADDALFMHCLPAHRGEEVSAGVIDGPQSAVWVEAENRLHAQKALLERLL